MALEEGKEQIKNENKHTYMIHTQHYQNKIRPSNISYLFIFLINIPWIPIE